MAALFTAEVEGAVVNPLGKIKHEKRAHVASTVSDYFIGPVQINSTKRVCTKGQKTIIQGGGSETRPPSQYLTSRYLKLLVKVQGQNQAGLISISAP